MSFIQGLNKDVDERAQPEGTYRAARNATLTEEQGLLRREDGWEQIIDLSASGGDFNNDFNDDFGGGSDGSIIGHVPIDTGEIVLFINGSPDRIVRWEPPTSSLDNIITSGSFSEGSLSFSSRIQSTYRRLSSGDLIIYWTDGVNPPRFLNVTEAEAGTIPDTPREMNIFPRIDTVADFDLIGVRSFGGSLQGGTYQLAFAYIDQDRSVTNYFARSPQIPIVGRGGQGADSDTDTGKSIRFEISSLDTSYEELRIVSIKGSTVEILSDVPIPDTGTIRYTYTGEEESIDGSLDEILVDKPTYDTAEVMEDHEGTLYMGNLTKPERQDLQKYVNNWTVHAVRRNLSDQVDGEFIPRRLMQDPEVAQEFRGYKRGEVYALYVSFLLDDGSETEAFHIPGRAPKGASDDGKAEATLSFTGAAPTPSDNAAESTLTAEEISNVETKAEADPAYDIYSETDRDVTFDVVLYDDSDAIVQTISTEAFIGESREEIADRIVAELNNSGESSNWTWSRGAAGSIDMIADDTGSAWNGYYIRVENLSVIRAFNHSPAASTFGGTSAGDPEDDHEITVEWNPAYTENSPDYQSSLTVTVSTLNKGDSASTVAGKYVTALQNDSAFTADFSVADNGDGTFTVTADAIGETYTHRVDIIDTGEPLPKSNQRVDRETSSHGWDGSTDTLRLKIDPSSIHETMWIDGIAPGISATDLAEDVFNALQAHSSYDGKISFGLSSDTITFTEETQTDQINGENITAEADPDVASFSASVTSWSGGGVSGLGDLDPLPSDHPLKPYDSEFPNTDLKAFHHTAIQDATGMGYWENETTYPDDPRWEVWEVDSNGNGKNTGQSLIGEPIRHHRFPKNEDEPIYDRPSEEVYVLGFQIQDVNIPDQYKDRIQGYRIYYAEKDQDDQIILDQGTAIHGWLDTSSRTRPYQHQDEVFEGEDVWTPHGFPARSEVDELSVQEWDVDQTMLQVHPMRSLRTKQSIAGATHVKLIADLGPLQLQETPHPHFYTYDEDHILHRIQAASYIDQGQRNVNLTPLGFSHDYDNLFGESKIVMELSEPTADTDNYVLDICQLRTSVHHPFENQELAWTGFTGDFSSTSTGDIFGGDIFVGEHYFKAHTLLALADIDAFVGGGNNSDYGWWEDDQERTFDDNILEEVFALLFGDNRPADGPDIKEVRGLREALRQIIDDEGGIDNMPIAWGTRWWEVIESRDNPLWRSEGDQKIETFYPASQDYVATPDLQDLPDQTRDLSRFEDDRKELRFQTGYLRGLFIFSFFAESDNYYRYNEEYSDLNRLKPAFPFDPDGLYPSEFPTRVIRSARVGGADGRRSAWRNFLEEDHHDLPQSKGDLTNIAPVQGNLILHTTQTLFQTQANQQIEVGGNKAFLGSGDVFSPPPQEMLDLDEGFGGLKDSAHAVIAKQGYLFIDQDARKIFRIGEQIDEISANGMRTYFRDNISDGDELRIVFDPHTERIFATNNTAGWTYSYVPGLERWASRHDGTRTYYIPTRDHLYIFNGSDFTLYRSGTGAAGLYDGSYYPFEIEYVQPIQAPETGIVVSLWIDTRVFDTNGDVVDWDTIDEAQITNSHQDTGLITVTPQVDESGNLRSSYNARLTDQAWKINRLRDQITDTGLSWTEKRRLNDNYHRVKLAYDTDGRIIEVFNSSLSIRPSAR